MPLAEYGEVQFLEEALQVLHEKNIMVPAFEDGVHAQYSGCPGSRMIDRTQTSHNHTLGQATVISTNSQLRQCPIQLGLVHPRASYLKNCHLPLAADCAPFAYPNFYDRFLKGKTLLIFCPKLDGDTREVYLQKRIDIFSFGDIRSLTIVHMEVPCCGGIDDVAKEALARSGKKLKIKGYTVGIAGNPM